MLHRHTLSSAPALLGFPAHSQKCQNNTTVPSSATSLLGALADHFVKQVILQKPLWKVFSRGVSSNDFSVLKTFFCFSMLLSNVSKNKLSYLNCNLNLCIFPLNEQNKPCLRQKGLKYLNQHA